MTTVPELSSLSRRQTERLSLRIPAAGDLPFVTELFSLPALVAHRPDPRPDTPEASAARLAKDMAHWEQHGFGRWAVLHQGRLIGFGGVTVSESFAGLNLSYHLHPSAWGQGFAGEIVQAALSAAFGQLGAARVIGLVRPANPASAKVLQRSGFQRDSEVILHGAQTFLWTLDRIAHGASGVSTPA